jgi:hypothetical protein
MLSFINPDARRVASLTIAVLASTTVFTACDDDPTDPVDTIEWLAELTGDEVEGIAAASSVQTSFEAAIEIENAEEDAVFTWGVFAGTCAAPGARVGAANSYPDLEVAANGTAEAEADVTAVLTGNGAYIVRVIDESGAQPVAVACGALEVEE